MSPPAITEPNDKSTCRLCGRQFAKYNCPTCNVAYCSLTCFRSETHTQCSETFYKKEVELDIKSGPSKTTEERLKMMELLKKFEEENQQSADTESDRDDDGEDLARRLGDVDIDVASTADLWSKLTPDEQAKFLKMMEDPNSDLAQKLLASEELENWQCEPWWDAPELESEDAISRRYGSKPNALLVPAIMVKPIPNGPPLFYNICAVCVAYSFVTRHLSISSLSSLTPDDVDFEEARRLLAQLVPFLVDRKSTTLYPNLSSLVTDMWSHFKPGQVNSKLFAILLNDTAHLIRPLSVITVIAPIPTSEGNFDTAAHPHFNLILALSDVTKLFEGHSVKKSHVSHKLLFYAAHVLSTPSAILRVLSEQLEERSAAYQMTVIDDVGSLGNIEPCQRPESKTHVIEEIR